MTMSNSGPEHGVLFGVCVCVFEKRTTISALAQFQERGQICHQIWNEYHIDRFVDSLAKLDFKKYIIKIKYINKIYNNIINVTVSLLFGRSSSRVR